MRAFGAVLPTRPIQFSLLPAAYLQGWAPSCASLLTSSRILNNGKAMTNSATYCNCPSDSSRRKRQSKAKKAGATTNDI